MAKGLDFQEPTMNKKLIDKLFALIIVSPYFIFFLCNVNGLVASGNDPEIFLMALLGSGLGFMVPTLTINQNTQLKEFTIFL